MKTTKEKKVELLTKENFIHISNLMIIEKKKSTSKKRKKQNHDT